MILALLFSFSAFANQYGFHIHEAGGIRLSEDCIPKKIREEVKSEKYTYIERNLWISEKEKESVLDELRYKKIDISDELEKACQLKDLQVYFEGKFYPLRYGRTLRYVISDSSECNYKSPRWEVRFNDNPIRESSFVLGPDFAVLQGDARKKAVKDFEKNIFSETQGYSREYFSRKNDKWIYMVFSETEMGTELRLRKMNGKKIEGVGSDSFEPCGS